MLLEWTEMQKCCRTLSIKQSWRLANARLFCIALCGESSDHLLSKLPDCSIPRLKRLRLPGAIRCATIDAAPADSPNNVIREGLPPNETIFSWIHWNASCWNDNTLQTLTSEIGGQVISPQEFISNLLSRLASMWISIFSKRHFELALLLIPECVIMCVIWKVTLWPWGRLKHFPVINISGSKREKESSG